MQNDNSKIKILIIILVVILTALLAAIFWYKNEINSPATTSKQIDFAIEQGTATKTIAQNLHQKGAIRSSLAFVLFIKLNRLKIQSGLYQIDSAKPLKELVFGLASGKIKESKVTIPEGWRVEQIARLLNDKAIIKYEDFIQAARDKQGRLFPDTYRIGKNSSLAEIVLMMESNFEKRLKEIGVEKLSQSDLILASIVEREAKHDEDRTKMAGVYKNRLRIGMALEADPTVQYAVDSAKASELDTSKLREFQFWQAVTIQQNKTFESSYNTYRHKGLPPGPIANPGIKSIEAAVNPAKHDYYFFFNLDDGSTIYSKTREEHNQNLAKYRK